MGGQWQLQQDAVDVRVVIKTVDQVGQVLLGGVRRQVIGLGNKAYLFAVFTLVRNINLGSRIAADQNHCQTRGAQALLVTLGDTFGNLLAQAGGDRFTVD